MMIPGDQGNETRNKNGFQTMMEPDVGEISGNEVNKAWGAGDSAYESERGQNEVKARVSHLSVEREFEKALRTPERSDESSLDKNRIQIGEVPFVDSARD
jgi:hypothetical protein